MGLTIHYHIEANKDWTRHKSARSWKTRGGSP